MSYAKVCSCTRLGSGFQTKSLDCPRFSVSHCPNHHLSIFFRFTTSYITKNVAIPGSTILACLLMRGAIFQNERKHKLSNLALLLRFSPLSKVIFGTKTNEFSTQHLLSRIHERISLSQKTFHIKFAGGDGLDLGPTLDIWPRKKQNSWFALTKRQTSSAFESLYDWESTSYNHIFV